MRIHKDHRRVRYRKGNGIAIALFTAEWLGLTLTGLTERMFFGESARSLDPDFITIGIAAFGGLIVTGAIGRLGFKRFAGLFFGGDEDKAVRVDKVLTVSFMIVWMVIFCLGINSINNHLYGKEWREKTKESKNTSASVCIIGL